MKMCFTGIDFGTLKNEKSSPNIWLTKVLLYISEDKSQVEKLRLILQLRDPLSMNIP